MSASLLTNNFPELGFGLGLRPAHYDHIFEHWPAVDWFEIISENFMDTDGRPLRHLARIAERYPVVMHGIGMSIGTIDPLNSEYLRKLKKLANWLNPAWISDHLCWTGMAHKNTHDLLPVPYTEEALAHIVERIKQVQDVLERPLALENPSTYLEFKSSHIPEAEFIARMAEQSGCRLLLDVNNVYVSCYNHRLDPKAYLDMLPLERVIQIHLSGHTDHGTHIIDTHDDHVTDVVWTMYQYVIHKAGRFMNTMVEWDDKIPSFDVLDAELAKAKAAAFSASEHAALPNLESAQTRYVANSITPLAEAQSRMQDAILLGAGVDSKPDDWIRAKAEFAAMDQLAVYVHAYRFRLYDATAQDYPVLKHYLGEAVFDQVLRDFVNIAQSAHFNIARYSANLPDFLTRHPCYDPFAHALAVLENTIAQINDAPETQALTPDYLETMPLETLMETVLYPRAALKLLAFEYPVNRYYRAAKENQANEKPSAEKSFLAVFRHEDTVWRMDVANAEYHLLVKLFSAMAIGDALEQVQDEMTMDDETVMANLSQWFGRWMRNGLLARPESYLATELERNAL